MKPYRHAYLELTNRCNRRCSFCPPSRREPCDVDAATAETWIDQIAELAEGIYWHVLGEPLLHPDFARLSSYAARRGLAVKLTTNASRLSEHADTLLNGDFAQINFSLQALNEVAAAERERVWNAVIDFTKRALRERPELYVNYRWWQDEPADLTRVAREFGIAAAEWRVPPGRHSRRVVGRLYATYDRVFAWPESVAERPAECRGGCRGLLDHFAVLSDGRVTACCLDAEGRLAFGQARETPIAALLDSAAARWIAAGFRAGERRMALCRNCGYATRF